ncbi:hypothetical protein EFQ99_16385 [Rhizobium vallis]|uniref:Uncharacterized protein n=1 Tax=Rhizobium vallis TaxID=634290 RepID=A0A432PJ79_9HYPH|nr:hypothetical protein [Rhizobium vallis]RUM24364.1 hypothetical protein EFQ99_16385 [Rhizobium vallis]
MQSNVDKLPCDKERIAAKKAYYAGLCNGTIRLARWDEVPRTLNTIRDMHRPELGLFRIGHRNHWTTTSSPFKDDVAAIQEHVSKINEKYPLVKKQPKPERTSQVVKAAKGRIESAVSQEIVFAENFHTDGEASKLDRNELAQTKVRNGELAETIRKHEAEIARLRVQLFRGV